MAFVVLCRLTLPRHLGLPHQVVCVTRIMSNNDGPEKGPDPSALQQWPQRWPSSRELSPNNQLLSRCDLSLCPLSVTWKTMYRHAWPLNNLDTCGAGSPAGRLSSFACRYVGLYKVHSMHAVCRINRDREDDKRQASRGDYWWDLSVDGFCRLCSSQRNTPDDWQGNQANALRWLIHNLVWPLR